MLAWALLVELGFARWEAMSGALAFLFCSTALWHFQNNQEHPFQFVLILTGLWAGLRWLKEERPQHLALLGAAMGLDVLVRLTALAEVAAVSALPLLVLVFSKRFDQARRYALSWTRAALPLLFLSLVIDRAYQFHRFGSIRTTYMHLAGQAVRLIEPAHPENFPFSHPFWNGFFGPLISLEKGFWVYDPLALVALVLIAMNWKRIRLEVRILACLAVFLLLTLSAGYAKFYNWGGESSWRDRFVTNGVWLMALLSVPVALSTLARPRRWLVPMLAVCFILQLASLIHPPWVEELQLDERWPSVDSEFSIPQYAYGRLMVG